MKKPNKFRVIKHTKYEKCDIKTEYYTIEREKSFLGFKYWSEIKQSWDSLAGRFSMAISFKTESDAIYAIKKLQTGSKPDGWVEEVTTVLDFNMNK